MPFHTRKPAESGKPPLSRLDCAENGAERSARPTKGMCTRAGRRLGREILRACAQPEAYKGRCPNWLGQRQNYVANDLSRA